jgi:hypothetical protein
VHFSSGILAIEIKMNFEAKLITHSLIPFPHWVIDNAFAPELVRSAYAQWPPGDWPHWYSYSDEKTTKLATRDEYRLPPACRELINQMCALPISEITGIDGLFPDFDLYGAGMHSIPSGGKLGVHLDGAKHPISGWKRQLSLVLFVNPEWETEWDGCLELWDNSGKECISKVEPRFNRLAIMAVGDDTYHGIPGEVRCPAGEMRKTLAVFHWSFDVADENRTRAEFV